MDNNNQCKAVLNMLTCCVGRDIFGFQENNGGYRISKFSNMFDILHILGEPLEIDKKKWDEFDFNMRNFEKRCFYFDLTKNTLNYIKEEKSDWLVLDAGGCRLPAHKIKNTYVAASMIGVGRRENALQMMFDNGIIEDVPQKIKYTVEDVKENIKFFAEEILKIYDPEQIILIDLQGALFHDNGSKIEPFNLQALWKENNIKMRLGFEILKKYLNGCHTIPMPYCIAADTNHRWGCHPLHYTKEYYDYAFKCVDTINSKYNREEENRLIKQLYIECSEFYAYKYYNKLATEWYKRDAAFHKIKKTSDEKRKQSLKTELLLKTDLSYFKTYTEYMKKMLLDSNIRSKIVSYFVKKGYRKIGFYALSKISVVIMSILQEYGFDIVFIMENRKQPYNGIKVIPRDEKNIPDVDCIVLTDMLNLAKSKNSISEYAKCDVISANDIIE